MIAPPTKLPVFEALLDPQFMANPAPVFSALFLNEGPGVYLHPADNSFIATRHAMLSKISRHPAMQAQNRKKRDAGPSRGGALAALFDNHPVFHNEPLHKATHQAAFRAVGAKPPQEILAIASETAAEIIKGVADHDHFDLVLDYSYKIAGAVWARLLGLPVASATKLIESASAIGAALEFHPSQASLDKADMGAAQLLAICASAGSVTEETESQTSISAIEAFLKSADLHDESPTGVELCAAMAFDAIDGAGSMTANFLFYLLNEHGLWERLKNDPSILSDAWTEAARLSPPILGLFRSPDEDVEIDGFVFPAGDNILTLYAAGNRDPRVFPEPDAFRLDRQQTQILSFGHGPRACVGRSMAKIIGTAAAQILIDSNAMVTPRGNGYHWGRPGLLRTIQSLPVEISAEAIR